MAFLCFDLLFVISRFVPDVPWYLCNKKCFIVFHQYQCDRCQRLQIIKETAPSTFAPFWPFATSTIFLMNQTYFATPQIWAVFYDCRDSFFHCHFIDGEGTHCLHFKSENIKTAFDRLQNQVYSTYSPLNTETENCLDYDSLEQINLPWIQFTSHLEIQGEE